MLSRIFLAHLRSGDLKVGLVWFRPGGFNLSDRLLQLVENDAKFAKPVHRGTEGCEQWPGLGFATGPTFVSLQGWHLLQNCCLGIHRRLTRAKHRIRTLLKLVLGHAAVQAFSGPRGQGGQVGGVNLGRLV